METIISETELQRAGFYWRESDGVQALVCSMLETDGFTNGFSTRMGGVSDMPGVALNLAGFNEDAAENILENRRRFLKLFPGDWTLAGCWQVHGTDVRAVANAADAKPAENSLGDTVYCDAIVSNATEVLAGVKTADCVPILIGDPRTGAFAAIHAGWRGTLAGIAGSALRRLQNEYDTDPANLRVAIGPAAAVCCYEVGTDVIDAFKAKYPDSDSLLAPTRSGHARIDLIAANRNQLLQAGVVSERIHTSPLCTMCRTDLFFSYRREKNLHGKVGRLMSVIGRSQKKVSLSLVED
jgi:purine-nucleoside/S-methyl-5'-thioadenosine phosphorylase / adenosine deaminase